MKSKKLIVIIAVVLGVYLLGYAVTRNANHDEHEGHDHSETSGNHDEHQGHDEHEGHDDHEGHDEHEGHDHAEHGHDEDEGHDEHDGHAEHSETSEAHNEHEDAKDHDDHNADEGCGNCGSCEGHDEDEGHNGHSHAGHGHDQGKSSQITVWDDRFEIFLEHPFVVANEPVKFVTHVTDRTNLKPRRKGSVTFVLTDSNGKSTKHVAKKPARDGIYIPSLTFPNSGTWNVSLNIAVGGKEYIVKLPAIKVYGSQAEVDLAPSPQEIAGIGFLKEQQWKLPFATEAVRKHNINSQDVLAVSGSAIIDENGKSVAFVQLAGEMFEERFLELGKKENGFVQVLSGLSEGEYVTTKGAHAIMETEHEPHDTELVVQLSKEDAKRFGIEVDTAGAGELDVYITVPGEITFNTNKLVHLVPTVSGIVRQVTGNIGDTVTAGEIITWIESTEVGGAKLDYLSKQAEMSCCSIELTRVQEIHDNTLKMLEILKDSPSLETLLKTNDSAMGMNRSRLISSYAEFIFARETYLREKDLYEKKIASKDDFLKAQLEFKKSDAEYIATKDSIAFEIKRDLLEAKRTRQILELEIQAAERLLYLHGLTAKDVRGLSALAKNANFQAAAKEEEEEECTDPNCKECAAEAAAKAKDDVATDLWATNEKLAWYPIRSPFEGTIIEKHIVPGELVGTDSAVYSVADLSSVWIDLQVHQKNIDIVRKGQKVIISSKSSVPKTEGVIDYVNQVINKKTRTSLARVILDNTSRRLRPGTFITAEILVENRNAKMMVSKDTLQDVDDKTCVFILNDHGFEARPVTVGWSNKSKVEIVSGLKAGEKVVTKNSFRLKAELEKTVGGSHAGHSH